MLYRKRSTGLMSENERQNLRSSQQSFPGHDDIGPAHRQHQEHVDRDGDADKSQENGLGSTGSRVPVCKDKCQGHSKRE